MPGNNRGTYGVPKTLFVGALSMDLLAWIGVPNGSGKFTIRDMI